jgi:hypothetical protein
MKGIHLLCIPFPDVLAINYTKLKICQIGRELQWVCPMHLVTVK